MKSLNKVYLKGHLGADPQTTEGEGIRFGKLNVATNKSYQNKKTGDYKQNTQWHCIRVINETLLDKVFTILKKGDAVSIEGELRSYETKDKEGSYFRVTEICIGYEGDLLKIHKEEVA